MIRNVRAAALAAAAAAVGGPATAAGDLEGERGPVKLGSAGLAYTPVSSGSDLGDLYLKQERVKDAADAFAVFAQRRRLHPQAAVLQTALAA